MRGTFSFQILSEKCGQQIWLAKFQLVVIRQAHFGSLRIALEHPPFVDLFRIGTRGIPLLCWIVAGYMPGSDSQNGSLNWSQHSIVNADLLSSTQMDGPHQIWLKFLVFVLFQKRQTSPEFSRQPAMSLGSFFFPLLPRRFRLKNGFYKFLVCPRWILKENIARRRRWLQNMANRNHRKNIRYLRHNVEPTFFLCWLSVFFGYEFGHKSQALILYILVSIIDLQSLVLNVDLTKMEFVSESKGVSHLITM